jgi:hypothetical protein
MQNRRLEPTDAIARSKKFPNDITFYHQNLQRSKAVLAHEALESDCSRRKAVPKATNKENNVFLPLKEKDYPS